MHSIIIILVYATIVVNKDEYINIVRACQSHFSFHLPSVFLCKHVAKFEFQFNVF